MRWAPGRGERADEEDLYVIKFKWRACCYFEPRDLWVGVFWDRKNTYLFIYICIVPCFPIRLCRYPDNDFY